jgi:hypothetical protein
VREGADCKDGGHQGTVAEKVPCIPCPQPGLRAMAIYELDGVAPRVAASAWVADSAQVMGDVVLGETPACGLAPWCAATPTHHHRRRHQHPGRQRAARRFRPAAGGGRARDGGPPGHAAWLHHWRRIADRHWRRRAQRRQDRQELPGGRGRAGDRGQGVSRWLHDHRQPCQGRARTDARADRGAAPKRGTTSRTRAASKQGLRRWPEPDPRPIFVFLESPSV